MTCAQNGAKGSGMPINTGLHSAFGLDKKGGRMRAVAFFSKKHIDDFGDSHMVLVPLVKPPVRKTISLKPRKSSQRQRKSKQ